MKIIHIEGGLGNQMACYAVYIATRESNTNEDIYIDTYIYDIVEAHSTISMWNGYELRKIFGIDIPDIRSLFSEEQVSEQIDYLKRSEFWKNNWNYDEVFIEMMKNYGYEFNNAYGNVGEDSIKKIDLRSFIRKLFRKYGATSSRTRLGFEFKKNIHKLNKLISKDCGRYLFQKRDGNLFYNITLDFMKSKYLQEKIGTIVKSGLKFDISNISNNEFLNIIHKTNSVSIHIRRTDYLQFNEDCYKFGYFKKCINYIKKNVDDPVFFVFSDDLEWCRNNKSDIGFCKEQLVYFVNCNSGVNSYIDMAFMANCKHNIATKSSFGWWASFLNENPKKITITQISDYVATKQF